MPTHALPNPACGRLAAAAAFRRCRRRGAGQAPRPPMPAPHLPPMAFVLPLFPCRPGPGAPSPSRGGRRRTRGTACRYVAGRAPACPACPAARTPAERRRARGAARGCWRIDGRRADAGEGNAGRPGSAHAVPAGAAPSAALGAARSRPDRAPCGAVPRGMLEAGSRSALAAQPCPAPCPSMRKSPTGFIKTPGRRRARRASETARPRWTY